jgi:hypothetical protein
MHTYAAHCVKRSTETTSILTVHPVHWQPQQILGELKAILRYNDTLLMPKTQRQLPPVRQHAAC